ncbi:MAG: TCR/Tet family MFS transporter [Pseudomonadota bacterium]
MASTVAQPPASQPAGPGRASRGFGALGFVIVTAFIDSMGIGLVVPVLPTLLQELTGGGVADAALWGGFATFIYAIMQFVFSPFIGGLSDRFGRRPVLLTSLSAFAVDMLILAAATSLWMFILARTLAGVFAATLATANAYVADITPPAERGRRFAFLGAAFGAGFVFGPAIGGALGDVSPRAPFYLAAAMAIGNVVYGYFAAPESLTPERRRAFSWRRANPFGTLVTLGRLPGLRRLLAVYFLMVLSTWVYVTVWSYVAIAKFDWSEGEIGFSVAYYGVISVLSQALVVQYVLPRIGAPRAIWIALVVEAVALAGIAFAETGLVLYAMISLALISTMQDPAIRQELSSGAPDDAQGELQGGLSALSGIAIILSPLIYNSLFNRFAGPDAAVHFPGAPFIVASVIAVLAALLYGLGRRRAE